MKLCTIAMVFNVDMVPLNVNVIRWVQRSLAIQGIFIGDLGVTVLLPFIINTILSQLFDIKTRSSLTMAASTNNSLSQIVRILDIVGTQDTFLDSLVLDIEQALRNSPHSFHIYKNVDKCTGTVMPGFSRVSYTHLANAGTSGHSNIPCDIIVCAPLSTNDAKREPVHYRFDDMQGSQVH